MVQTADGSADAIDSLLTRMRQLAVESQNGTMSASDQRPTSTPSSSRTSTRSTASQATPTTTGSTCSPARPTPSTSRWASTALAPTSSRSSSVRATRRGLGLNGTTGDAGANILTTLDTAMQTLDGNRSNFGAAMNRLQDAASADTMTQTLNLSASLSTDPGRGRRLRDRQPRPRAGALASRCRRPRPSQPEPPARPQAPRPVVAVSDLPAGASASRFLVRRP